MHERPRILAMLAGPTARHLRYPNFITTIGGDAVTEVLSDACLQVRVCDVTVIVMLGGVRRAKIVAGTAYWQVATANAPEHFVVDNLNVCHWLDQLGEMPVQLWLLDRPVDQVDMLSMLLHTLPGAPLALYPAAHADPLDAAIAALVWP